MENLMGDFLYRTTVSPAVQLSLSNTIPVPRELPRLVATSKRDLLQRTLRAYLLRSSALMKAVPLLIRKINS